MLESHAFLGFKLTMMPSSLPTMSRTTKLLLLQGEEPLSASPKIVLNHGILAACKTTLLSAKLRSYCAWA